MLNVEPGVCVLRKSSFDQVLTTPAKVALSPQVLCVVRKVEVTNYLYCCPMSSARFLQICLCLS